MDADKIFGRNPVLECIKAGRAVDKIFVKSGSYDGSLKKIIAAARDAGIKVVQTDKRKLDEMAEGQNHQGVIAVAAARQYADLEDILKAAESRGEDAFLVVCDRISDPHNLGSIIRTALGAGAHGVIISKHESAGLGPVVAKVASGALELVPVARVTNISKTLDELKKRGVWVTGTDAKGEKSIFEADFSGPVAVVIGSEGDGMSRLVREKCDFLVNIPMAGGLESLNASVVAALIMYEVARARINKR